MIYLKCVSLNFYTMNNKKYVLPYLLILLGILLITPDSHGVETNPKIPFKRTNDRKHMVSEDNFLAVEISGLVTDDNSEPLIGVNVLVKGTTNGTSTDINGRYTLSNVENNDILVFSYVGYQT